jgi:hypothetical protein
MIVYAPAGGLAAPSIPISTVERAALAPYAYVMSAGGNVPQTVVVQAVEAASVELRSMSEPAGESFDWSSKKVNQEFTLLQQRALAGKASDDEKARYNEMKRDRNSQIFADRYVSDYAEVERLKKLSHTLAELEKHLKPITF